MNELIVDELVVLENKLEKFLEEYQGEPVGLYGAGAGLIWYIKLVQKYHIHVVGIVDSVSSACGEKLFGYPKVPLDVLLEEYKDIKFIISAPGYAEEIKGVLSKRIGREAIYSFDASIDILQKRDIGQYRQYILENKKDIESFYHCLADEKSKYTFAKVLQGWLTYETKSFQGLCEGKAYFPEFLCDTLSENEVFVDMGAYTGDSIMDFIFMTKNKFEKIYAFEADENSINILKNNIFDNRVEVSDKAVSDKNETLFFIKDKDIDEGARIAEQTENSIKIEAVALDNVINEKITYIKMDIEGSELKALKGSEGLIKKYRPKLAICIYHKKEDIVHIPQYIMSLNLDYRMYVRHYWDCAGTDLILYCI